MNVTDRMLVRVAYHRDDGMTMFDEASQVSNWRTARIISDGSSAVIPVLGWNQWRNTLSRGVKVELNYTKTGQVISSRQ